MRRAKIVVADDDEEWLELVTLALRKDGHRIFSARGGREALEQVSKRRPDCIILDYDLGDQSALEVSRAVKATPELSTIPVIVHSGHTEQRLRSYRECLADHFLVKDGGIDELCAVVQSVLRRKDWDEGVFVSGDLRLASKARTVSHRGRTIMLSAEQFEFLKMLVQRAPQPVSSEDVSRVVLRRRRAPEDTDAIRSLAHRMREALGSPLRSRIKSIKGFGWIYVST